MRVFAHGGDVFRQAVAPVRVGIGDTGDVERRGNRQQVFRLDGEQFAAAHRHEAVQRQHDCLIQNFAIVTGINHVRLSECGEHLLFAHPPLFKDALVLLLRFKDAQLVHGFQIVAGPEAQKRRQVVRTKHRQRLIVIILRHPVIAVVVVEIHHAIRIDAVIAQRLAHLLRDDTKILADDDTALAVTFQRKNRHQIGKRITHIRAEIGVVAISDPPQAAERHDVVNAQNAIDAHIGAQHLNENAVAAAFQALRMQRRQIPVLPGGPQLVRRRADGYLQTIHLAVHPRIRTAARHADRQIAIQAQTHPRFMTGEAENIELFRHQPLQPHIKTDIRLMRHRKRLHRRAFRVTVRLRPAQPADTVLTKRNRSRLRIKIMIERFKRGIKTQITPATLQKLGKRLARIGKRLLRLKIMENQAQRAHLQRHHLRIIDPIRLAQPPHDGLRFRIRKPRLRRRRRLKKRHPAHININRIQPAPGRRTIRTCPVRASSEKRVQRINADKINPVGGKIRDQAAQIAQIANAPIMRRTQTVQLHIDAAQTLATAQRLRLIHPLRRDNNQTAPHLVRAVQLQRVIPGRQGRQLNALALHHHKRIRQTVALLVKQIRSSTTRQHPADRNQRHHLRRDRKNLIKIREERLTGRGQNRRKRREHLLWNTDKTAISGEIIRFNSQQSELLAVHDTTPATAPGEELLN